MVGTRASLARQGTLYLIFGLCQIGLDWAVFVAASALGLPTVPANLLGRVSGACFGFFINGKVTFASSATAIGAHQALRFAILWGSTSLLSTVAMVVIEANAGLSLAWLGKPVVDLFLSGLSFLASRHWVYKKKSPN